MAFQFKMPDIGEGIAEGEIVKIDIKVGDTIQEDDILFEVQNDKSVEEIPSPVSGKVLEVKVQEGTVARVGDIIVVIDDGSGPAEASAPAAAPAPAAPAASSTFQFKLPDIGEGIAEGEIVKIDIKVGDKIAEDDILFEVQNDKSVESIPSPVAGTVTAVLVSEGTVAHVGDVIVEIATEGGSHAPAAAAPAAPAAAPAAPAAPAVEAAPAPAAPVASTPAGADAMPSPMPGNILRILVNVGDTVSENQPLMILEAMKMENEIVAAKAGVVAGIHVKEGQVVNPGDALITIN